MGWSVIGLCVIPSGCSDPTVLPIGSGVGCLEGFTVGGVVLGTYGQGHTVKFSCG